MRQYVMLLLVVLLLTKPALSFEKITQIDEDDAILLNSIVDVVSVDSKYVSSDYEIKILKSQRDKICESGTCRFRSLIFLVSELDFDGPQINGYKSRECKEWEITSIKLNPENQNTVVSAGCDDGKSQKEYKFGISETLGVKRVLLC